MKPSRPSFPLRAAPMVAVALAAAFISLWLAGGALQPHSLFATTSN